MGIIPAIATYFVIWWLVLLLVLPFSLEQHQKALRVGHDSGAPHHPKLLKKMTITTLISALILGVIDLSIRYDWVNYRRILDPWFDSL